MRTIATVVGLASTAVFAVMWACNTMRHRSHLDQCVHDLQRQRRLDRRLAGCVAELEQILDVLPASRRVGEVPEELVGHVHYLHILRVEASDNVVRLSSHAVRLRWPRRVFVASHARRQAMRAGARCPSHRIPDARGLSA